MQTNDSYQIELLNKIKPIIDFTDEQECKNILA